MKAAEPTKRPAPGPARPEDDAERDAERMLEAFRRQAEQAHLTRLSRALTTGV